MALFFPLGRQWFGQARAPVCVAPARQGTHTFTRVCGSDKPGTHTFTRVCSSIKPGHPYIHRSVQLGQARAPIHSSECGATSCWKYGFLCLGVMSSNGDSSVQTFTIASGSIGFTGDYPLDKNEDNTRLLVLPYVEGSLLGWRCVEKATACKGPAFRQSLYRESSGPPVRGLLCWRCVEKATACKGPAFRQSLYRESSGPPVRGLLCWSKELDAPELKLMLKCHQGLHILYCTTRHASISINV